MNQALENEKARALAFFRQNVKSIAYSYYSKDRLGCCGGDYCEGNHNENIEAFLNSVIISSFTAGEKAGVESMVSGIRSSHKALSLRELKIVGMRFGFTDGIHHTQEEVGREFGVKRERIGQIEATALGRLRSAALK